MDSPTALPLPQHTATGRGLVEEKRNVRKIRVAAAHAFYDEYPLNASTAVLLYVSTSYFNLFFRSVSCAHKRIREGGDESN